jgi:glycosyltransferase involved in cell wall biosynthesis
MRVLYDTYWWSTGPVSGGVVAREILKAWMQEFPGDEFVLGVRPRDRDAVAQAFPGARTVRIFGRPHGVATASQYAWHARRHRVDVTYTQTISPPGVWSVIFVHDVLFQTNPEWFTRPERAYFKLITTLARGADLVVTSSEHEAQRIRENNARVRRVEPIGLSVASALVDSTPVAPEIASGLDGFTLTVGRLNVRKNLRAVLLGALESGRLTPARPLIVVGSEEGRSAELPAEAAQATRDGLVRFVPHVTDGELSWLYAHADVFVYLALDEGFGLPPVEALHFGTPVVVSDIAVFHENLGSFATYVDPQDTSAVARTLREISEDRVDASPVLRSWASCAQRLRSAIERARS